MLGSPPAPHERVYVFHGSASTQVLGSPRLVGTVTSLVQAAGVAPHTAAPAHPDIAARPFTQEFLQDPLAELPEPWDRSRSSVAELAVDLAADRFWDRVSAGCWATWSQQWPAPEQSPLFPPHVPDWLGGALRFELDPLAPALGPAAAGGWIRSDNPLRDPSSMDHVPVGLFQLTDIESFWVLTYPDEVRAVADLCETMAGTHAAFTWLTGYFDPEDRVGSLRLPVECLPVLAAALTEHGYAVDTWW